MGEVPLYPMPRISGFGRNVGWQFVYVESYAEYLDNNWTDLQRPPYVPFAPRYPQCGVEVLSGQTTTRWSSQVSLGRNFDRNVTKFASLKALKLIV